MLCYKCGKDTEEFNGCKCNENENLKKENLKIDPDNLFGKEILIYPDKQKQKMSEQIVKEKYSIVELPADSSFDGYSLKKYEIHFEGKQVHTLEKKDSAELFCRLLNENEANKSLPNIDNAIVVDKRANNKSYYKHEIYGYIRINHDDGDYSEICRRKDGSWSQYCRCTE